MLDILHNFLDRLFLGRRPSSPSKTMGKKTVVVVGGGFIGSQLARRLSATLDSAKHTLILVDARPYALWLIAGCRMTVTDEGHLEERCFVPYDNLFVNGNGTYQQGKVVSINVVQEKGSSKDTIVLEDGERVEFDALVLATGSSYTGPVAFPDNPTECIAHIEQWRGKFKEAEHVCLVGGGGVAVGTSSFSTPYCC